MPGRTRSSGRRSSRRTRSRRRSTTTGPSACRRRSAPSWRAGLELRLAGAKDADVYRIHNALGKPCPRCGTPLARVDFEEHTIFYCPSARQAGAHSRTGGCRGSCAEESSQPSDRAVSLRAVIRTQPTRGGWLEVVCGPMFSGKSEELIRRLRRAEIAGQRALIVKPVIDNRYDVGRVVSHAGASMRAVTASTSDEVMRLARGYDAVGIDEVQFFDDGIADAIDGPRPGRRPRRRRRTRTGLSRPPVRRDADAALRRRVRRQARSRLPPLRRPGDDDAAAGRRRARAVRRRDDPGRRARLVRSALPELPLGGRRAFRAPRPAEHRLGRQASSVVGLRRPRCERGAFS